MGWSKAIAAMTACMAMLGGPAAWAHEFWMVPDAFRAADDSVMLAMRVGENFSGELVGLSAPFITQLHRLAGGKSEDLRDFIPAAPAAAMAVPVAASGTQLFWADTQASRVVLDAGRFHAYLHDEGLDAIIAAREKAGAAETPGRERFRRNVKTLVSAGGEPGSAALQATGQRLEILPLSDPAGAAAGRDLPFQVLWDGKPLANALVKLWHRRAGQLLLIRVVTNAQGKLLATPPFAGVWMASVVHMVPAVDSAQDDWDSYWGSLTFELRDR